MANLLVAEVQQGTEERTEDCPDAITLAAYAEGLLQPEQSQRVSEHVVQCKYCIDCIRLGNDQDVAEAERALDQAEREIDAHNLAKEIADWLVEAHYPEEKAAVTGLLDTARDDAPPGAAKPAEMEMSAGFPFSLGGRSRAVQIVELSRFAGRLLDRPGTGPLLADEFGKHVPALKAAGIQDVLLALVLQHLRDG